MFIPKPRHRTVAGLGFALAIAAGAMPIPAPAAEHAAAATPALEPATVAAAHRLMGAALTSDHAWLRLSELCDGIGHRLSGSKALEKAVRWAQQRMQEDGLDRVWLQPVRVPHWVRGEESAVMVEPGPQTLSILGLGRSVGTPRSGITADVVVAGSFREFAAMPDDAIRGKIVLWDVPFTNYGATVRYRGAGARRAAARGAVATLVRSVGPVSLRTPHTGSMSAYVDSFPKIPGAAVSIEDAAMMRRLLERGERVRVRLRMEARTLADALSHNVIGEIRGRELPDEVVLVGGHLDSWDVGQGAHDDGGGCVISMEALRLIRALDLRPRRTLRVVLWTNEENGLRGAEAYRDSLHSAAGRHVAAIESDGGVEAPIGFAVQINRANSDSVDAARTALAVERMRPLGALLQGLGAQRVTDNGGGADIGPLMEQGVPGIAHRTVGTHYFDWHHTASDMMDKVDPTELRQNVAAMTVMAWMLADMPGRLDDPPSGGEGTGAATESR